MEPNILSIRIKEDKSLKVFSFLDISLCKNVDQHGLQTPNEAFFHRNPYLLGLGRQFGQINLGTFGIFWPIYQHPFWYSESLVHVFY